MRKLKPYTPVEVAWADIEEDPHWQTSESVGQPPETLSHTLGYYLGQDAEFLYVTATLTEKGKQPGNRVSFPKGCVLGVYPVTVGREALWRRAERKRKELVDGK